MMKSANNLSAAYPWVPTPEQEQLLSIVLAPQGCSREAGLAWLSSVNLAAQQSALNRLLPMVQDRLQREGVVHPLMEVLKGVRRKVWSRNQLLLKRAATAVQALRDAGIPVMLLKGTAMIVRYYQDSGLRAMADVDLMVPFNEVDAAIEILRMKGWTSDLSLPEKLTPEMKLSTHAIALSDPSGLSLDLHWHVSHFCLDPQADLSFWEASETVDFAHRDVRVLNPADQLLHLLVHGLIWVATPGIRWIPDACLVIRKHRDLDWNRLISEAQNRRLVLFVNSALNYLAESFAVPIPRQVLSILHNLPVTNRERNEFAVHTQLRRRSPSSTPQRPCYSVVQTMRALYYDHKRNAENAARAGFRLTRCGSLRAHYNQDNNARLAINLLARLGRHLWLRMGNTSRSTKGDTLPTGGRAQIKLPIT